MTPRERRTIRQDGNAGIRFERAPAATLDGGRDG
jgi:hypothetical protein